MIQRIIQVNLSHSSYPIYVGNNIVDDRKILAAYIQGHQVLIVTQANISRLYLTKIINNLIGYQCDIVMLPQGEMYKNIAEWEKIITVLSQKHHERSTTLLALGGGVVGDMTGFAAACYQRGVNYIQIPTTLIAQVDSAIGGKTGINHAFGKNKLGAFHQPQCVIADIDTLLTLPSAEFNAGLAEVIKYGLIGDADFFSWLETNVAAVLAKNKEALLYIVTTCAAHKAAIVAQDEKDQGQRQLLNFGHTLGHALETAYSYQYLLHGEAVAVGMVMAARLSSAWNGFSVVDVARIEHLLAAVGLLRKLPKMPTVTVTELVALMKRDKKVRQGKLTFILLQAIGNAVRIENIPEEYVTDTVRQIVCRV